MSMSIRAATLALALAGMWLASSLRADDGCDHSIFDSGAVDGLNAISNERSEKDYDPFAQGVVLVRFAEDAVVTRITWWGLEKAWEWTGEVDLIALLPDGKRGAPGTVVTEFTFQGESRNGTGQQLFNIDLFIYTAQPGNLEFTTGDYWFGVRPAQKGDGRSYWPTSPYRDINAYWRSEFFHEVEWIPIEKIVRNRANLALCLSGYLGGRCIGQHAGDANCDGVVDFTDIDCFVAALVSEDEWNLCGGSPGCEYACVNDVDGNGAVAFDDIDPFVECLVNGCD